MTNKVEPSPRIVYENFLPLVSIVVTTKNEEKNIENCLISIKAQTYKNIEVIVVDNFSTDRTVELARRDADRVEILGPERSAQRNHGMIDIAKGEFVLYIDADMILSPILIENCIDRIGLNDGALALHLPEVILGSRYLSKVRRYERQFYDGTVIDGARFFNREVFCDIKGFDSETFQRGSGEDWDIDKKIKRIGKICLLNGKANKPYLNEWKLRHFIQIRGVKFDPFYCGLYHNEAEFSVTQYLKKKLYYSEGFDGYIKKWGRNDPDIRRQFGFWYRYLIVFVESGKWRRMLSRPDLMIGMYILRIAVGITFIYGKCKFFLSRYIKE
ncbi:glycosyltransferase family A protein [Polynucleobacter sp. HIN9]|uniref:glycosyltransferase family 2 protein n=1 Tax=Polynucleobacter sp. HIN9 TaxID=3047868 RepID=UPI002572EEC1|nr:glycosyltransferase family A protein [Polynucleobacter sp. HIN9]BEI40374.1 glycosyltransferase family A protein [Polynucleobacter sp. HIN9]